MALKTETPLQGGWTLVEGDLYPYLRRPSFQIVTDAYVEDYVRSDGSISAPDSGFTVPAPVAQVFLEACRRYWAANPDKKDL